MLIEVKSGCIFIGFEIVVDCGVAQSFERFQEQRNAECILMHIVEVWATAEVFDRTVLPSYLPRKPNGCLVLHNWNVDRAFQRAVIKPEIGRAHVCTPVTNAHLVCRLLLEKKKKNKP